MTGQDTELGNLADAVARGDKAAFARLYEATSPKLFAICLRMLGDRAAAEDVLQEVYVKLWHGAARFDRTRGPIMAWLIAVTRNRAIDALRQRGRQPSRPGADPEATLGAFVDPGGGPGAAERLALIGCLGQLSERQREIVLLAYYEGYSREELALRYSRPTGTIETWLRAALKALRACLEPDRAAP